MGDASNKDTKENELSEIELCYKAMGLSFSDNPEQVEKTYRKLKDEYARVMRSTDPAERSGAEENLRQLEELFKTITGSLIYKDYAREYEKYREMKAEELQARKQKQAEQPVVKEALVNCPYCHKPIAVTLKKCIYCHGKILTPMEQVMAKIFSTRNLVILTILVLLAVAGLIVILNPELLKR